MTAALVVVLTAIPVAVFGYLGARVGGRRLGRLALRYLLASACGAAFGAVGVRYSWSWPFGLVTPVVASLLAAVGAWMLTARVRPVPQAHSPSTRERRVGAALGGACGVIAAGSLWIGASLLGLGARPPEAATASEVGHTSWTHALVRTANRGFVRHLPMLGPLGDEMEATVAILNSSHEARRKLARGRHWEQLTALPSYRALADDADVTENLAAVRRGNVVALYRLQRNPLVVAFMHEPEVRALLPEMRPTILARELEALTESPAR